MYRVGYKAVKKSKIAHHFFVTKATDLKTIFLKSPWQINVSHFDICDIFISLLFFQPKIAFNL